MKIFVEGIDGSGKTTLINKIVNMFPYENFKIVHCTRETPNNYKFFSKLIRSEESIIFDRFCWGQKVYQTESERIANGWCSDEDIQLIENYISSHREMICVYIDTPLETCYKNCLKDKDDNHYTFQYISDLKDKYYRVLKESSVHWLILDNDFSVCDAKKFDYKSLPKIYAVDFDGTLIDNGFPNITSDTVTNIDLINKLKEEKNKGTKLILWTNRTDSALIDAVAHCKLYGLEFDAINDNIREVKDAGLDPRKIYADLYIDDKAVRIKRKEI